MSYKPESLSSVMSEEISIKVNIADVIYPMTVTMRDEENVRKAAKLINEKVRTYREEYQISDKSNILSMVALQFACELMNYQQSNLIEDDGISEEIRRLNSFIEDSIREIK